MRPSDSAREEAGRASRVRRRRFLAALGASALGGIAGCGGDGDGPPIRGGPFATATATPVPLPPAGATLRSPGDVPSPTDGFATVPERLLADDVEVVRVTTLDAGGAGSLRSAVSGSGPRLVVFEVGGVIDLDGGTIEIADTDVFVAGQTAPSPGITIVRGGLTVRAENVVVQHLRVRPGDEGIAPGEKNGEGDSVDALGVIDGRNVIFDHCTATWGTDENKSTSASVVTFSNGLIAEGLADSIHPEGEHSRGTLVRDGAAWVSLLGNLWAHNARNNPYLNRGTSSVVVNNLAYGFESAIRITGGGSSKTRASVVGNHYLGDGSFEVSALIDAPTTLGNRPPGVYVEDNRKPAGMDLRSTDVSLLGERPIWPDGLEVAPSGGVRDRVLANAGARPADRTPHDRRVISNVRARRGGVIDSQEEVGGYPDLESTERGLDVPDSGLSAWLHEHTRAVELPDAEPP